MSTIMSQYTFFLDFLQTLRKMSLMFQMDDLLACSIPRFLEESLSTIEKLHLVPGENFRKLCTNVTSENRYRFSRNHIAFVSTNTK